jgi:hypothetical protein
MYTVVLYVHSYLRWVVVVLGLVALVRAIGGWAGKKPWEQGDTRLAAIFIGSFDLQFLLGLVLWWQSPYASLFRGDVAKGVKDNVVRYWGLEHPVTMLIALAVVHIVNARAKRRGSDWRRHRSMAIALIVWVVLVAAAFPWPWQVRGRPLLRF